MPLLSRVCELVLSTSMNTFIEVLHALTFPYKASLFGSEAIHPLSFLSRNTLEWHFVKLLMQVHRKIQVHQETEGAYELRI
jgi:hypothetical protein